MTKRELMDMLENIAADYIIDAKQSLERNFGMNDMSFMECKNLSQAQIDGVIVDFINAVGLYQGLDEGLYVNYLYERDKVIKK